MIAENKDEYNKWNEQFGKCVKLEVLVVKEYVDRMKEGPNDIDEKTGERVAVMSSDFFLVALRLQGLQMIVHVRSYHEVCRPVDVGEEVPHDVRRDCREEG